MRRPQFSIRTLLWLTLVVAVCCTVGKIAERLYLRQAMAATRAELEECRKELRSPIECGVVWATLQLERERLEKRLASLEAKR